MDTLLTKLSFPEQNDGGGEGEEESVNREKCYEELTSLIKEDDSGVLGHHLSLLTEFLCNDLLKGNANVKEKCLSLLGALLHSKHCATTLTAAQSAQIINSLCDIINNSENNTTTTTKLAVWCIEVQSLPPERLPMKVAESICNNSFKTNTESIEYEALGALEKLLFHANHLHLEKAPNLWAPPVLQRSMSQSPQLRSRAFSILSSVSHDPALSELLYTSLAGPLSDTYSAFISACQCPGRTTEERTYPVRLWGVFASILGTRAMHGRTAQRFLRFQEGFFAHSAEDIRAAAFDAWAAPVRLFQGRNHQKLFELLYKPFLFVVEKGGDLNACVVDAALRTWKVLVGFLQQDLLVNNYDKLFDRFAFKIVGFNPSYSCTVLEVLYNAVTLYNKAIFVSKTDNGNDVLSERIKAISNLIKSTLECNSQDMATVHKLCLDSFKTIIDVLSSIDSDNSTHSNDAVKAFIEEVLLNNTSVATTYNTHFALDLFTQASSAVKEAPQTAVSLALKLLQMSTFSAPSERKTLDRALTVFELFAEAVAFSSPEELETVVTQVEESTLSGPLVQDIWSAICTQVKAAATTATTPRSVSPDFCVKLLGMAFSFAGACTPAEAKCAEGDWDIMMAHFADKPGICEPLCARLSKECECLPVVPEKMRFFAFSFRSFVSHFKWGTVNSEKECGRVFVLAAKALTTAHASVCDLENADWVQTVLETVGLLMKECSRMLPAAVSTADLSKVLALWADEPIPQSTGKESDDRAVAAVKEGMISLLESFLGALKAFFDLNSDGNTDLTRLLRDMDGPLAGCLRSKHRRVKNAAVDTWNTTFGASAKENFEYSPLVHSALADLRKVRTTLTLPLWKDDGIDFISSISSPIKRSGKDEQQNDDGDDDEEEEQSTKSVGIEEGLDPPSQKKPKVLFKDNENENIIMIANENRNENEKRQPEESLNTIDNDDKETLSFGDVIDKDLCCSFTSAIEDFLQAGRRILNDPQAFANTDSGHMKEVLQMALKVANKVVDESNGAK